MDSPKCLVCRHCISKDIGYSEYTITGAIFRCGKDMFVPWTLDDETPNDIELMKKVSEACPHFSEGEQESTHYIDCDIDEGHCTCDNAL